MVPDRYTHEYDDIKLEGMCSQGQKRGIGVMRIFGAQCRKYVGWGSFGDV